ncbi:metal-dependent transcriptional regulator [Devriesea agamarum]|uniref:metal-dependent transcriptional regulator n=1 Tax=Devriesea agamarum TaxID=472569 RepID=UPI00071E03AE|nr:metal-dependent transcriptional regulator [Devriesea agamarum]
MSASQVSASFEDYLKVIWSLREWSRDPVTVKALAERLGYSPSSVSEAVKKLVAAGLVAHEPYGGIELTTSGHALAVRIIRRHRVIEMFLVDYAGYAWDEVHDEAEVLEHAVSDHLVDALWHKLGHPSEDPHGDPIPDDDGILVRPTSVPLNSLSEGERGRIVRVSDQEPELLRHLADEGIVPGVEVEVVRVRVYAGLTTLRILPKNSAGDNRAARPGKTSGMDQNKFLGANSKGPGIIAHPDTDLVELGMPAVDALRVEALTV